MLVEVAESGAFPAAEGVIGDRHGDRHVHADHAHLHARGEIARRVAVAGEYGDAVAIFVIVAELQGVFIGIRAHHRQDRAEDLFLVDAHVRRHMVEEAAAEIIAVLIALHLEAAPIDRQRRAFRNADVHIAAHPLQRLRRHQRAIVGGRVRGGADLQALDAGNEAAHQFVRRLLAHWHSHRDRHAALARRAIARADEGVDRLVHVRIGHHDQMVLGAAEALHPLARGAAARIDIFGDGRGADEADGLNVGIVEQRVHRLLVAVDHIEDAGRQARFQKQFGQHQGHGGVALAGLQDEGVAAGDGGGEFPHGDHGGEIERRDARHHAERLAQGIDVDVRPGAIAEFALQQMRNAAGEFHHFHAALNVALGVGNGLAMLAGQNFRELVVVTLQQLQEFHQHARAALGIGGGPGGLRGLGVLDRRAHFGPGGQRHAGDLLAGHGLPALGKTARRSRDMLAADEMGKLLHGRFPSVRRTPARSVSPDWDEPF